MKTEFIRFSIKSTIMLTGICLLVGCKPRQSELSDDYSSFRDQNLEVQAMYHLMQRDYKEGETVFLHTDMFRVTVGEEQKELPPGFPTWNQMFQPYFKDFDQDTRLSMTFAYYNFFEEKQLAEPWNEWADEDGRVRKHFPLIKPPTENVLGTLNHYLLKAEVIKEFRDPNDGKVKKEHVGDVEWLMDTEYAPEATRMALFLATTPMFSPDKSKVAENFFEPFHIDFDLTYQVLFLGLPYRYSPIYLEPCNNPGRPYRPDPKLPARRVNRFVPGSSRQVTSVSETVQKEYQTFPFGSLMMAADNEHGADFLTGVDLGEYLWELEDEQAKADAAAGSAEEGEAEQQVDDGLTAQERVDRSKAVIGAAAGEHGRFNSSLRKVVVTRLLINTQEDITDTAIWSGKRRPIVIGYPSTEETKNVIRVVNQNYKNAAFLGHKYKIVNFQAVPYELKNLVLTRQFLPNLARRGCGGGTVAERIRDEAGYHRIKLPDMENRPKPIQPEQQRQSPFFPTAPGQPDAAADQGQEEAP